MCIRDRSYSPQVDALAAEGVVLERMYTHKFCGPSRAAIQSGRAPIHVSVFNAPASDPHRYMFSYNAPPHNATNERGGGGYAGIPEAMTGLGAVMKSGGYRTYYVGKWDAGSHALAQTPYARGYEYSLNNFGHFLDAWTWVHGAAFAAAAFQKKAAASGGVRSAAPPGHPAGS